MKSSFLTSCRWLLRLSFAPVFIPTLTCLAVLQSAPRRANFVFWLAMLFPVGVGTVAVIVVGRRARRDGVAFLHALPIPTAQVLAADVLVDLFLPALLAAVVLVVRPAAALLPLGFLLAALVGTIASRFNRGTVIALLSYAVLVGLVFASRTAVWGLGAACLLAAGYLALDLRRSRVGRGAGVSAGLVPPNRGTWRPPFSFLRTRPLGLVLSSAPFVWMILLLNGMFTVVAFLSGDDAKLTLITVPYALVMSSGTSLALEYTREALLTRPVGRRAFLLYPLAFTLVISLAPSITTLALSVTWPDARLADRITSEVQRGRPRSDDRDQWVAHYGRVMRKELALLTLPPEPVVPNPDRLDRVRYLPSPALLAAARTTWQGRELRIVLVTLALFALGWRSHRALGGTDLRAAQKRLATSPSDIAAGLVMIVFVLGAFVPDILAVPLWAVIPFSVAALAQAWWRSREPAPLLGSAVPPLPGR
jgi:hypothetical protein